MTETFEFKNKNPYVEKIKEFKDIVLTNPISWRDYFSSVCLDIGCGNGEFLLDLAIKNPDKNYLAFELQYKEIYRAALKINKSGIKNAKILRFDASKICDVFKKDEVLDVNILFPDPWPKIRQRKNRLINKSFISSIFNLMKKGSFVKIKTDDDDYFLSIINNFREFNKFKLIELSRDIHSSSCNARHDYITPFERIFIKQGKLVNYLLYQK